MATVTDVARYLLSLVDEDEGDFITLPKQHKLLYYCQGFHLALHHKPLFADPIRRGEMGPVVETLCQEYADAGNGPLGRPDHVDLEALSEEERDLVNEVYEVYGAYSATALKAMTREEPPWRDTAEDDAISHQALTEYFGKRLREG